MRDRQFVIIEKLKDEGKFFKKCLNINEKIEEN